MSKFSIQNNFFWRYKVSFFFILTYWVMDPILYLHFGNAYTPGSSNENKWLVFFTGPFSFTEDFDVGTPFTLALKDAALSGNFWMPFSVILLAELILHSGFKIGGIKFSIGTSYLFGVISSYLLSAIFWHDNYKHTPITGTSVIAFSLIVVYWFFLVLLLATRVRIRGSVKGALRFLGESMLSISGISVALIFYIFGNQAAFLHLLGFLFFIVITLFASRFVKIDGLDLIKREKNML